MKTMTVGGDEENIDQDLTNMRNSTLSRSSAYRNVSQQYLSRTSTPRRSADVSGGVRQTEGIHVDGRGEQIFRNDPSVSEVSHSTRTPILCAF